MIIPVSQRAIAKQSPGTKCHCERQRSNLLLNGDVSSISIIRLSGDCFGRNQRFLAMTLYKIIYV
jgi:hypothetical protein